MKRILCYGDSNTWGLMAGTTERYGWGVRWTSRLQNELSEAGFQIIEEGLCGRTTVFNEKTRKGRSGADFLPVILESQGPLDLVILMLGTNDCKLIYNASVNEICDGIECLLHQIRSFSENCNILLISPIELGAEVWKETFDPEFGKASVELSRALKPAYRKLADKWKISFMAASDYAGPSVIDMEHMDYAGHEKLAEAVKEKVLQIYREEF